MSTLHHCLFPNLPVYLSVCSLNLFIWILNFESVWFDSLLDLWTHARFLWTWALIWTLFMNPTCLTILPDPYPKLCVTLCMFPAEGSSVPFLVFYHHPSSLHQVFSVLLPCSTPLPLQLLVDYWDQTCVLLFVSEVCMQTYDLKRKVMYWKKTYIIDKKQFIELN